MDEETITINKDNLFKIESFTDIQNGEIRHFIAITEFNEEIPEKSYWVGMTHVMTPHGVVPVNFKLTNASTLGEAIELFPLCAKARLEELQREIEQALQEEHDKNLIVTPNQLREEATKRGISVVK